ncbi:hypothetical protein HWQ46_25565 [Shewanella sp. D64]|uniref:hypothetical protein n=1 Tax=unclassified Shewanella TaxID=196818 RepID=UPI0022BA709B|nr:MULTISPECIES: hypothetical protein [unclassified Shewanella]MEC4728887.1 hypothetical protein [Shewanella sp. D64]MEC4740761.1 hypothetical protein [Shewanella sp. E94]WBJ94497.1 hypothetical protein HWQ47_21950 [Shewanella sp. MTB7]
MNLIRRDKQLGVNATVTFDSMDAVVEAIGTLSVNKSGCHRSIYTEGSFIHIHVITTFVYPYTAHAASNKYQLRRDLKLAIKQVSNNCKKAQP